MPLDGGSGDRTLQHLRGKAMLLTSSVSMVNTLASRCFQNLADSYQGEDHEKDVQYHHQC